MRPRHKTAENPFVMTDSSVTGQASMRPRHKTAENHLASDPGVPAPRAASMRPRHKTAENPGTGVAEWTQGSMLQ